MTVVDHFTVEYPDQMSPEEIHFYLFYFIFIYNIKAVKYTGESRKFHADAAMTVFEVCIQRTDIRDAQPLVAKHQTVRSNSFCT